MMKTTKKLNTVATKTASQWIDRANEDSANRRNLKRAQLFALELMEYMEINGIKQVELAQRMAVSPQQVNKILRAKANLTFETLDKIADALDITISSPKIITASSMPFQTKYTMQIVHRHKQRVVEEDVCFPITTERNPILTTTLSSVDDYRYTAEKI